LIFKHKEKPMTPIKNTFSSRLISIPVSRYAELNFDFNPSSPERVAISPLKHDEIKSLYIRLRTEQHERWGTLYQFFLIQSYDRRAS